MPVGSDGQVGVRKRPTAAQFRILGALELGGHIERGDDAVLVSIAAERKKLRRETYWMMQDRGWLWMAAPGVWRITTAGRAALARRVA